MLVWRTCPSQASRMGVVALLVVEAVLRGFRSIAAKSGKVEALDKPEVCFVYA